MSFNTMYKTFFYIYTYISIQIFLYIIFFINKIFSIIKKPIKMNSENSPITVDDDVESHNTYDAYDDYYNNDNDGGDNDNNDDDNNNNDDSNNNDDDNSDDDDNDSGDKLIYLNKNIKKRKPILKFKPKPLKKRRGGSKKSSWVWELMKPGESITDGIKYKTATCQVNISEVPDKIINCNVTLHGSGLSTSNYISHLMSAHGITKENYKSKLDKKPIVSFKFITYFTYIFNKLIYLNSIESNYCSNVSKSTSSSYSKKT
jgi:hypothetical protein